MSTPGPVLDLFFGYAGLTHDSGPGHPESPARLSSLLPLFDRRVREGRARWLTAPADSDLSLYRAVHDPGYIDFLETLPPSGFPVPVDGDTQVSLKTVNALREIAGVVRKLSSPGEPGRTPRKKVFCAVRPPGHHAHFQGGMGFCAVNHVALLCVRTLLSDPDGKILILDFDVHHGNGTADILGRLFSPDRVLFVSTHRYPFYPGTGSGQDNRTLPGGGGRLDIPLAAGTDDDDYQNILEGQILPRWEAFSPDTVLVSAGFDAHVQDPLGDTGLTEKSYERIGRELSSRERGLTACFLEGGYHLSALPLSVEAFLDGWESDEPTGDPWIASRSMAE